MPLGGDKLSRWAGVLGAAAFTALMAAGPAQAGLLGAGRTVQATYYNGTLSATESQIDSVSNTSTASLATSPGATFLQGSLSSSVVSVTDTQVIVTFNTSVSPFPYCSSGNVGSSCGDTINGFGFSFAGENITGVSVDALSATSMAPVTATYGAVVHTGLTLLSNNSIQVDLTGDLPAASGNQLILDVTTAALNTPEPASVALLAVGLFVVAGVRWGRRRSA